MTIVRVLLFEYSKTVYLAVLSPANVENAASSCRIYPIMCVWYLITLAMWVTSSAEKIDLDNMLELRSVHRDHGWFWSDEPQTTQSKSKNDPKTVQSKNKDDLQEAKPTDKPPQQKAAPPNSPPTKNFQLKNKGDDKDKKEEKAPEPVENPTTAHPIIVITEEKEKPKPPKVVEPPYYWPWMMALTTATPTQMWLSAEVPTSLATTPSPTTPPPPPVPLVDAGAVQWEFQSLKKAIAKNSEDMWSATRLIAGKIQEQERTMQAIAHDVNTLRGRTVATAPLGLVASKMQMIKRSIFFS